MTPAAELLRSARVTSGLTQRELGERAGVTQSVISAYESGRREPSLTTLSKLVGATGLRLETRIAAAERADDVARAAGAGLRSLVRERREELEAALGALGATGIRVFGSVARGEATSESDVDLLVQLDEGVGLFNLARMRGEAERILGVAVDVVPEDSLKADVRESVLADAVEL
ncbi:helix-turn-helix domain-containing protein [Herbiconiux flava]|uniref:HTH cro/C1-type domain-containing protein n=1 Tax=Herbiconiux flava TaxID=881268 RepID=A0A852SP30_9MICO|nr:helix-turn-helix domain-containing protein [Herbiconiux flava]NYD70618.1 hypothetical protein [Herbiconiux flava]